MGSVITLSGQAVHAIQKIFARKGLSVHVERPERSVLVHGDAAVIQQIAVVDQVNAAFGIKESDMFLQLFAVGEGKTQLGHNNFLGVRQFVRASRVDGRKMTVQQRINPAVQRHGSRRIVDFLKQQAVFHLVMGPPFDQLALQLELDDGDGFLHLRHQADFLPGERTVLRHFRNEHFTGVLAVSFDGERRQRHQADAVAVFQRFHVAVAQAGPDDVGDAGFAAGGRPHPQNVVIAPLDIDLPVFHQRVQNLVRPRPPVVNIADHMEPGDRQSLDQFRQMNNKRPGAACGHDGPQQPFIIV